MSTELVVVQPYADHTDVVPGIRITDIIVGDRARKNYGDLTPLMDSIQESSLLQPIGVLPGNRLLFGGRRLEACRRLGWESIPFVRPTTRDDALSLLKAERDENTCRLDMTPEELVDVGLRIEEIERPNAEARQADGQRRGGEVFAGREASTSRDVEASDNTGMKNPTAHKVGAALGLSSTSYQRAKHVVQVARGDIEVPDDVRETAKQALTEMNTTGTINGAYTKVRKARKLALVPEIAGRTPAKCPPVKSKRPEMLRGTHHIKTRRVIAATVDSAAVNTLSPDHFAELNLGELEAHDLEEWISSLSESIKALRSLKTILEKELSQRG